MKQKLTYQIVSFLVLFALLAGACYPAAQPTSLPTVTLTLAPASSPTPDLATVPLPSESLFLDSEWYRAHIPAADKVRITCKLPASMTLDQARAALRVRSLYDSYTELTS